MVVRPPALARLGRVNLYDLGLDVPEGAGCDGLDEVVDLDDRIDDADADKRDDEDRAVARVHAAPEAVEDARAAKRVDYLERGKEGERSEEREARERTKNRQAENQADKNADKETRHAPTVRGKVVIRVACKDDKGVYGLRENIVDERRAAQ